VASGAESPLPRRLNNNDADAAPSPAAVDTAVDVRGPARSAAFVGDSPGVYRTSTLHSRVVSCGSSVTVDELCL
jgi:hypothetical protein